MKLKEKVKLTKFGSFMVDLPIFPHETGLKGQIVGLCQLVKAKSFCLGQLFGVKSVHKGQAVGTGKQKLKMFD